MCCTLCCMYVCDEACYVHRRRCTKFVVTSWDGGMFKEGDIIEQRRSSHSLFRCMCTYVIGCDKTHQILLTVLVDQYKHTHSRG